MSERKAFFFDIDGTLCDFRNRIPRSTKDAVRSLRGQGHLTFLCSGRSRAYIQNPELLEIGFDGIISACGAMIEYNGGRVFERCLDPWLAEHTVRTVRSCGFRPILEGPEYLYMDWEEFRDDPFGQKVSAELGGRLRSISGCWGGWEINKLSCATEHADRESCFRALSPYFDYIIHNEAVVEMVPKGCNKGTGIGRICEMLHIESGDTFAFGDSVNDLGMFQAVGTSIAMGSGTEAAKEAADYVTAPILEDGIWQACLHFGLIKG